MCMVREVSSGVTRGQCVDNGGAGRGILGVPEGKQVAAVVPTRAYTPETAPNLVTPPTIILHDAILCCCL